MRNVDSFWYGRLECELTKNVNPYDMKIKNHNYISTSKTPFRLCKIKYITDDELITVFINHNEISKKGNFLFT